MSQPDPSDVEWRRADPVASEDESNVEIAIIDGAQSPVAHKTGEDKLVLMRDAKQPDGPILVFTPDEWDAFIGGVKDGEFDLETFPAPEGDAD